MKKNLISLPEAAYIAAGLAILLAVFLVPHVVKTFSGIYERTAYLLLPSAERAYAYGTKHFNALHAADYDIDRAEQFFVIASKKNPQLPLLQHQLARIAFLRGDYVTALERINLELEHNPSPPPSSYYVRGLIEGFMGKFADAAKDYETYLKSDPKNWAAINDYAWVLLKAGRVKEALTVTTEGLKLAPDNPWLLNSNAIALYETGRIREARVQARAALQATANISQKEWLTAYPGNDPITALEGISALQMSAIRNMHTITIASSTSGVK